MDRPVRPRPIWRPSPRRNPLALAVTAAAAIVVSVVVAWVNHDCIELVVASSNEKFELLTDIASTYKPPSVDRKCVQVQVIKKASGSAERSLARDWADERQPRPDVWSPAATTWILLLTQDRKDAGLDEDVVLGVPQSLMQSPLVIAMPEKMRDTLLRAEGKIGWDQIFGLAQDKDGWAKYGKPDWGQFKLGKTNPTISTSGLHALISVNYAAVGTADSDAFLAAVESRVVHYSDSVQTFLSNLRVADQRDEALTYVSAIAVEEKQVFDYNRGNPTSGLCRPTCPFLPPKEKLVPVYPIDGTLIADHPYAILKWTDDAHRQAALDFQSYLESTPIQRQFQAEGFRDYRRRLGPTLTGPTYDQSGSTFRLEPPDPAELAHMLDIWSTVLRKPAHALFVVDVGRSMSDLGQGETKTKLDLAKRAASDALKDLAPKDTIGLWTFPTKDGSRYRESSSLSTPAANTSELVRNVQLLDTLSDDESFYETVHASVDHLHSSFDPNRINAVVVLTGGGYSLDDQKASGLISYLQGQREDQRVRVSIVGYGTTPASNAILRRIAEASRGSFYDVTDPTNTISEWMRNAMSNF